MRQPFIQRYGDSLILLGLECMVFSLGCRAVLQVFLAGAVVVVAGIVLRFGTRQRRGGKRSSCS